EKPLPSQRNRSAWIFTSQRERERHRNLVHFLLRAPCSFNLRYTMLNRDYQRGWQQSGSILTTFAVSDYDRLISEVYILDTQTGRLDHPQPRTVHKRSQ